MLRVYGSDEDTCGRDILEHRYVVQQAWGYKLDSTEVVLHVNGDIYDNRLENLYVTKGLTEAGKIIHGSLPWPSAGNVLGGLPRQFADKWGPSQSTIRDKRNGGVDIRFRPYECHKDDV